MRLRSLHLLRFGNFTDHTLDFGDSLGKLQIVYGANESGKSTTLRAIGDLLYGFEQVTRDAFLHDMTALRVGARFAADDGTTFDAYRRKGKSKTLLDAHDQPLDIDPIAPLLSAADRQSFERTLGLDHDRLRRGGEELLKGGGKLGLGLFQAGVGVASVRQVLEDLDQEADSLFRPKGSTQRINRGLKRLSDERAKMRQASLSEEKYHRLDRELQDIEEKSAIVVGQIARLEAQRQQRQRVRANLGPIALRNKLQRELGLLADIPSLAPENTRSRQEAEERLHKAIAKRDQAASRLQDLEGRRSQQPVAAGVLTAATDIKLIENLLTTVAGAVDDLPKRESTANTLRASVEGLLRDARLDVTAEVAEQHLPPAPQVQLIRRLADERESLVARYDELSGQIQELESEVAAKTRQLDSMPECTDPEHLERALQVVLKLGPIEKKVQQLRRDVEQQENLLAQALQALPLWHGTVEQLRALPVPLDATVARVTKELQSHHASLDTSQQRLAESKDAAIAARQELDRIQQAGDVPTSTAVAAARKRRERGWKLLRRAYVDANEDVATEAATFDQERRLPEAYEEAVRHADDLIDRRQAETARVSRFEHAAQKLHECQARELSWVERVTGAKAALDKQQQAWGALWAAARIEPLPPEEMRDWLQDRGKVVERADRVANLSNELSDDEVKVREAHLQLASAIRQVDASVSVDTTLEQLVVLADRTARTLRTALERRNALKDALLQLDAKQRTMATRLSKSALASEQWAKRWGEALAEIHCDSGTHPAEVRALLDVYDSLRVALTQWNGVNSRVLSMRNDRDNLSNALTAVIPQLAPELTSLPIIDAAATLVTKLDEAKKAKDHLDHLDEAIAHARGEIDTANGEHHEARGNLARLCALAGCTEPEQLEDIEAKASRKRQVEEELREVEKQLLQTGFGFTIDELVRESEGLSADTLAEEIQGLSNELNVHRETEKTLIERRAGLRNDLAAMTGTDEAANGAQRAESLIAGLCESAEHWQILKVASELLRRGIERYRERNQGPLMGRAGAQFRALTLGRYVKLSVDYGEKDEPVLMGMRPDGREISVPAMSDGTRDQLHLALRLAVLEQLLSKGETLPVIADDLLIHFDDERSTAALQALCALAQKTQVLYFTHHRTVVELARKNLDKERFAVQELPG